MELTKKEKKIEGVRSFVRLKVMTMNYLFLMYILYNNSLTIYSSTKGSTLTSGVASKLVEVEASAVVIGVSSDFLT